MNKKLIKKIIITGGHVTPALAVISELKKQYPTWQIVFIGRRYALEGSQIESEEYQLVQAAGIRFVALTAGRLTRVFTVKSLISFFKMPLGFGQAMMVVWWERPDLIVSFGGYLALPVVLSGWLMGIPIITHEQTRVPGLSNRIISFLARRICVSFANQVSYFPKGKAVYTGLPLRSEIFSPPRQPPFEVNRSLPLLFFAGGATGAASLNEIIFVTLPELLRRYSIIHQVGRFSWDKAKELKSTLSKDIQTRYVPIPYLKAADYSWVVSQADLVISRAGANTVGELAALGKIAILVPLPWSAGGEQEANARWLKRGGGTRVLLQKELTPQVLVEEVEAMRREKEKYKARAGKFSQEVKRDGAIQVVGQITTLLDSL